LFITQTLESSSVTDEKGKVLIDFS